MGYRCLARLGASNASSQTSINLGNISYPVHVSVQSLDCRPGSEAHIVLPELFLSLPFALFTCHHRRRWIHLAHG